MQQDPPYGEMQIAGNVEVADHLLITRSPLLLPSHRCVRCGSTEPGGALHQEIVNYVHPVVWLTFFISGLITLIAYFFTRKPIELQYYLCPVCEDRRRTATLTTKLVGVSSLLGMMACIGGGPFEVFLGAFFIAMFARLVFVRPPLRAVGHSNGLFSLQGASPKFLRGLERQQLEP